MFKWIWRFFTHGSSLWARVIKAIHGEDGKIGKYSKAAYPSLWLDIVHEMELFKKKDIDIFSCMHKKLGNGANTAFWEDVWRGDVAFKHRFPRLYALKTCKGVDVAAKLAHTRLVSSFRREPRGGVEHSQLVVLLATVEGVVLIDMRDRWVSTKTRWIKAMPIKVNVHAWKMRLDCLPTRLNISQRGMYIDSILCPICDNAVESSRHIFFNCNVAREILRKIARWWDVSYMEVSSYEEW
ncbi:RNA-directed DNA polymerase, eukaryota, reverse transcriptase zinc-binding domain protein [Tanacetum coccineum]